jgi:RHS repeat-associated protein
MCTAADANGGVGYSYTPEGWISGRAFTVGSTSYTVGYAYNAMGQVVTVIYPDGNQALYNYTNGVVSSVSLNIGGAGRTVASQITYRPQDKAMASWVGSNGLTTTLFYDTDGRFTGANVPGVLTYGVYYDNASRIIRKQDFISPILTESFGYDDQSRLVSVQGGAENEAYQYDANGNRIAQTVNGTSMTLIYEGGSNRMINAGGVTFGYDAMGNSIVANGISRWQFDPFNRMTTAFGNTYYIDPLGQRLMKSVGSATTYFAPDEGNHLMAENDSGLWVDYLWLNGRLIARTHGGQMEDIHLDQVGRPEAMTNADQTLAWRAMNTPFTRSVATNNAVPLNIGFPGQYYDAELSLWNNGYRDYFPWVGRYLESDPIGLEGGINTYAYVGDNPVSSVDPTGRDIFVAHTSQVGGLHEKIVVGQPDGEQYGQSFGMANRDDPQQWSRSNGPTPGGTGSGEVYEDEDPITSLVEGGFYLKTTPEEDAMAIKYLQSQLGNKGPYNVLTNSCRTYSEQQFANLLLLIIGKRYK